MKTRFWLLLTILLALSMAACQSAATPKPAATEAPAASEALNAEAVTEAPTEEPQNLSEEGQAYPPQGAEVQAQPETLPTWDPSSPYPAPSEAEKVDWSKAEETILSGDVLHITQTKALEIYLLLKDGRMLVSTEPVLDEVMRVKEACGDKCSHVVMTNE